MSLLSVVNDVCAVVGVLQTNSVFTNIGSNREMQEMVALATEMAQRIAYDTREWRQQKTSATFVGDGVADPITGVVTGTTAFDLPANYLRMLKTASVWRSTSTEQPMVFISDYDEWLVRRAANESHAWGEWTLLGNQMLIWPVMAVGVSATFAYLDKNCVVLNSGGFGDRFVDDNDTFRLPERLLKLGMTWQWKAQKGSPYAEDMGSFGDALTIAMGSNKPAPIIIGNTPSSWNARVSGSFPSVWGPQP